MKLKRHFRTAYNLSDILRKICNFLLSMFYKNPVSKYLYGKKLEILKNNIKNQNISYIVNITEGIGNQMFQYAFAKKISKNKPVILNIQSKRKLYRRPYSLFGFNINLQTTDLEIPIDNFNLNLITEKYPSRFESEILNAPCYSYFKGYFQSYKYFNDIKDELIKDFEIKAQLTDEYIEIENKIKNTESVLLNFRLKEDYRRLGWAIETNYQKEAVQKMKELLPDKKLKFFIFADDIKEVKKHFKIESDMEIIDLGKNNPDKIFLDLNLMSKCKYDIITNSSFSFWAAYLNQNKDKKVIAPIPWFFNEDEITPPDWTRLKAKKIKVKNPEII